MNEEKMASISSSGVCFLLTEKERLEEVNIQVDNEKLTITFVKDLKAPEIKIIFENVEEIREGLKTDAWINTEQNLSSLLKTAQIYSSNRQSIYYFSIVYKSIRRILPGETKNFVSNDANFIKELKEKFKTKNQFLLSTTRESNDENSLFNSQLRQDMNQPMSHYFIASSHNSYLTGNQLFSDSSYEIYRNILLDGCRCIEIDIWEGDFEPVVTHGYTGTSKILLGKVLEVINEFAFVASEFPLIISIENHLKQTSQTRLAQMLNDILGNKLFIGEIQNESKYPKLSDMKNKIFIKDYKKLKIMNEENLEKRQKAQVHDGPYGVDSMKEPDNVAFVDLDNDNSDDERYMGYNDLSDDEDYDEWSSDEESDVEDIEESSNGYIKKYQDGIFTKMFASAPSSSSIDEYIGPTYSQMVNYFEANKFKDIKSCIEKFKFYQMFSQKDYKSLNILITNRSYYQQFTSTNMVRVYPRGLRVNSSNYRPERHWFGGAQMVALNYQTITVSMLINWAQFALNGGCGYVLKPAYLLDKNKKSARINLNITIEYGQFENLFSLNQETELQVTTRVYCPDSDKDKRDRYSNEPKQTQIIRNEANKPIWNHSMETYHLSNPELSFVRFSLYNFAKPIGYYMIAVQAIRKGNRYINLFDKNMKQIPSAKIYLNVSTV